VVLEHDGAGVTVSLVVGDGVGVDPAGAACQRDMVLDHDAVLDDGERRLPRDLAIRVKLGAVIDDVIALPLARLATGIDQRDGPAIQRRATAPRTGRRDR